MGGIHDTGMHWGNRVTIVVAVKTYNVARGRYHVFRCCYGHGAPNFSSIPKRHNYKYISYNILVNRYKINPVCARRPTASQRTDSGGGGWDAAMSAARGQSG